MVHILKGGLSLCRGGAPSAVPAGDRWIACSDLSGALAEVDCWKCVCFFLGRPIPEKVPTPEHDKLAASDNLPQRLCEFVLEWLPQAGITLAETHHHTKGGCGDPDEWPRNCGMREGEMFPSVGNSKVVSLAADFVGVDKKKFDAEKDALLKYVREMDDVQEWARTEGREMIRGGASGDVPRCDKAVKAQNRSLEGFFKCDEEPGHGGAHHTKLYRR